MPPVDFPELRGSPGPMSLVGAGLFYLERPDAPLTVAALATLSGRLEREELLRGLESRLPRLPRLRQHPVPFPFDLAYPSWEDAPQFRAADHVYHWGLPGGEPGLALRELAAQLVAQPLRPDRPLWELHLVDGLPGGRSALLLKVHHCLLEGVAGTRMLELLLGRAGERARTPRVPLARPATSRSARLARALGDRQRRRLRWLRSALRPAALASLRDGLRATRESARKLAADEVPRLAWNVPLGPRRRICLLRWSLEDVERIRRANGATLEGALLAILAGGLQRFLAKRGDASDLLELMVLIPVTLPGAGRDQAAGRFSALRVRLPVRAADDRARLRATRAVLDRLEAQRAWSGVSGLLHLAELLPPPLFGLLARRLRVGRIANLIASNVAGPRRARFLCGRRIDSIYPLMPILDNVGLSLAAYSYAGALHLGLNADAERLADLDALADALQECFECLGA
jgi:WS/DGAT/MGAT family acyltransferase